MMHMNPEFREDLDCKAKKCIYPINCTRRRECLSLEKEKSMETQKTEEIHHFKSGASSSGHKPPYETLTITLLRRAAKRMEKGLHYGKHNWKKGIQDKQFVLDRLNHAIEHLIKAAHEIDYGIKMTDDDLSAVVVNCMFAMEYQEQMDKDIDPTAPVYNEGPQSQL